MQYRYVIKNIVKGKKYLQVQNIQASVILINQNCSFVVIFLEEDIMEGLGA